jgi:S-adenosylmethionine hydrolase
MEQHNPIITLTTDFGYKDPFVGIMKGVILSINPSVNIVDIAHDISPQNIMEAAFSIEMCFASFPPKTIHVVVIDPGVGTSRRPILAVTDHHYLIGPDNGVFSRIYSMRHETFSVIHITAEHYFLPGKSSTFHGRDVFAPVAAWLSRGINVTNFGDHITDYVNIQIPVSIMPSKNTIEGTVIYVDHFGNAITNIHDQKIKELFSNKPDGKLKVLLKSREAPFKAYYSQAEDNGLYSLINSFGYLELFMRNGNASVNFNIPVGEKVGVIVA